MSCRYREEFHYIEIKEAYDRYKLVNKEIEICIDAVDSDNKPIFSIDYENEECSGYYIDINYCFHCGRYLKGIKKDTGSLSDGGIKSWVKSTKY